MISRYQMSRMLNANVGPARLGDKVAMRKHHPVLGYSQPLFTPEQGTIFCMNMSSEYILDGTIQDLSPQANHGTISGCFTEAGGPFKQYLSFDGDDKITCANDFVGLLSTEVTVEAWINQASTNGQQGLLGTPDFDDHLGFYLRDTANQQLALHLIYGNLRYYYISQDMPTGEWSYLVGTINISTNTGAWYLNGEQLVTGGLSSTTASISVGSLSIGYIANVSSPDYFTGGIAAMRVTNRAKPAAEVRRYYHGF